MPIELPQLVQFHGFSVTVVKCHVDSTWQRSILWPIRRNWTWLAAVTRDGNGHDIAGENRIDWAEKIFWRQGRFRREEAGLDAIGQNRCAIKVNVKRGRGLCHLGRKTKRTAIFNEYSLRI